MTYALSTPRATQLVQNLLLSSDAQILPFQSAHTMMMKVGELRFEAKSEDDLFTLEEVFGHRVYEPSVKKEFIAIDVGANIGISALYLASLARCLKVYAFEPFQPTSDLACRQMELNSEFAKKIKWENSGLGIRDEKREVFYSPRFKTCMTTSGLPSAFTDAEMNAVD